MSILAPIVLFGIINASDCLSYNYAQNGNYTQGNYTHMATESMFRPKTVKGQVLTGVAISAIEVFADQKLIKHPKERWFVRLSFIVGYSFVIRNNIKVGKELRDHLR